MAPAKAEQVGFHGFRQITHLAIGQRRKGAVALGQFRPVRSMDQGDVSEFGDIPAHRLIDRDLAESIPQMVIAPDHMRHAHIVVIHHHGQHVGRGAVGAQQDHVVQFTRLNGHAALNAILKYSVAAIRRAQAHSIGGILGRRRRTIAPRRAIGGEQFVGLGQQRSFRIFRNTVGLGSLALFFA